LYKCACLTNAAKSTETHRNRSYPGKILSNFRRDSSAQSTKMTPIGITLTLLLGLTALHGVRCMSVADYDEVASDRMRYGEPDLRQSDELAMRRVLLRQMLLDYQQQQQQQQQQLHESRLQSAEPTPAGPVMHRRSYGVTPCLLKFCTW
ncbi:hypothetical protein BOX15_Mlig030219g1, partial [Macrostomum lignano]